MNDIRLSLFKTWNVRPFGGGGIRITDEMTAI